MPFFAIVLITSALFFPVFQAILALSLFQKGQKNRAVNDRSGL